MISKGKCFKLCELSKSMKSIAYNFIFFEINDNIYELRGPPAKYKKEKEKMNCEFKEEKGRHKDKRIPP